MRSARQRDSLTTILVSFRDPDDPMIEHEERCFRAITGLASIEVVSALRGNLGERELAADLLLFGGSGSYGVDDSHSWLKKALDFFLVVAARGTPAWASCFGFQGLAVALGGTVSRDEGRKRLGAHPVRLTAEASDDPLFATLPAQFHAQFGHHDHVVEVPSGVTVLATGVDGSCLGMRVDNSRFWGAQFHPELCKATTLDRWRQYRPLYAGTDGAAIDRHLHEAPDTPEAHPVLTAIVELAEKLRVERAVSA